MQDINTESPQLLAISYMIKKQLGFPKNRIINTREDPKRQELFSLN